MIITQKNHIFFIRGLIVLHIKGNLSKFVQQISQHGYPITLSDL